MDLRPDMISPRWLRVLTGAVLLVMAAGVLWQYAGPAWGFPGASSRSDKMYYSGFLVTIPAVLCSLNMESRFGNAIRDWRDHQLVAVAEETWSRALSESLRVCRRWQIGGALATGVAVAIAFDYTYFFGVSRYLSGCLFGVNGGFSDSDLAWLCTQGLYYSGPAPWAFILASPFVGMLVGYRLGTMAGASRMASRMARVANLKLRHSHPDGVGGYRAIGKALAENGILACVPIIWLTVWVVLLISGVTFTDETGRELDYTGWVLGFIVQLILGFVFLLYCFVLPYLAIRRRFGDQRRAAIISVGGVAPGNDIDAHIAEVAAVHALPTSPVFPALRFAFSISSLGPFFTLSAELALPGSLLDTASQAAPFLSGLFAE